MPILKAKKGLSLVEILLALFLVIAIIGLFLTVTGTYKHIFNSSLRSDATKIASREIENLRDTDFASLPSSGSITDSELTKLPSGAATRTVADYQGISEIKLITISITWEEQGVPQNLIMETLISQNGI